MNGHIYIIIKHDVNFKVFIYFEGGKIRGFKGLRGVI